MFSLKDVLCNENHVCIVHFLLVIAMLVSYVILLKCLMGHGERQIYDFVHKLQVEQFQVV